MYQISKQFFSLEFRECFYLYARRGQINTMDELTVIMRSLGMSPTIAELRDYMKQKGGKMAFADFLDVMHQNSTKENIPKELLAAFRGSDPNKKGVIPAKDLWHILVKWGEKVSPREGKKETISSIKRGSCQTLCINSRFSFCFSGPNL